MRRGTRLDTFCSDFGRCCFCLARHKSNLGRMTVLLAGIVKQHMKSHRRFREVAPVTPSELLVQPWTPDGEPPETEDEEGT